MPVLSFLKGQVGRQETGHVPDLKMKVQSAGQQCPHAHSRKGAGQSCEELVAVTWRGGPEKGACRGLHCPPGTLAPFLRPCSTRSTVSHTVNMSPYRILTGLCSGYCPVPKTGCATRRAQCTWKGETSCSESIKNFKGSPAGHEAQVRALRSVGPWGPAQVEGPEGGGGCPRVSQEDTETRGPVSLVFTQL